MLGELLVESADVAPQAIGSVLNSLLLKLESQHLLLRVVNDSLESVDLVGDIRSILLTVRIHLQKLVAYPIENSHPISPLEHRDLQEVDTVLQVLKLDEECFETFLPLLMMI